MRLFNLSFIAAILAIGSLAPSNYKQEMSILTTNHTRVKDLTVQFASFFTNKDADGIGSLLTDNFALYDPALQWIQDRQNVVDLLQKQFQDTKHVSHEVVNAYEDGDIGILEFKITLDQLVLYGVDFMEWENGKMAKLRCYYNPPSPPQHAELKPLSSEANAFREGEIYEHYKGNRYKIVSVGRNSETLEEIFVYQALYGDHDIWVRPLKMFSENIVVNEISQPRFKRIYEAK